jgi:hypothetical protein
MNNFTEGVVGKSYRDWSNLLLDFQPQKEPFIV